MASPDATRTPKRRWLSFSLRGAFVLLTIVCVWLAVVSTKARKQARAVSRLQELGGIVVFDYQLKADGSVSPNAEPNAPRWLREAIGEEYFREVVRVYFAFLGDSKVSDADLDVFDDLGDLTSLDFSRNPAITDSGLRHLADLHRLRTLDLNETNVTGAGFQHLPRGLEILELQFAPLGDAALGHLKSMTSLRALRIGNTAITDELLTDLSTLMALEELDLRHTEITDAGLSHLAQLTNLKRLVVNGTNVTGAGVAQLQQTLPNCRIAPTPERLNAVPQDVVLWPAGHHPTKDEILAKVKELGGKAAVDPTDPAQPIAELELLENNISDESLLILLESMPDLRALDLRSVVVGDRLAQGLPRLSRLEFLSLSDSRLTDAGMVYIGKLTTLRKLAVMNTSVSDAGLGHLTGLINLETLAAWDTRVTAKGRAKLQEALPNCRR